jgi:DNA-binding SARP family transcriptional activator
MSTSRSAPERVEAPLDEPPVLEVAVLGRVEVRVGGHLLRIGRAKSVELLVYLAVHRDGVDADRLWEALWPDRPMRSAVLHTTVSVARRSLREGADRPLLVSDARGGRVYQLTGPIELDWERFEQLAGFDRTRHSASAYALDAALALVRGSPFTSTAPGSYDWARGYRTEIEAAIGSVAESLGLLRLDHDDVIGARRAARQGLRGAPYDERLYRLLMRAAHASEHPSGIDSVMQELTDVLGAEPDATESRTRQLYQTLRRPVPD